MFGFRRSGQVLSGFLETKIERDKGERKDFQKSSC
jgi:hypothetical protein